VRSSPDLAFQTIANSKTKSNQIQAMDKQLDRNKKSFAKLKQKIEELIQNADRINPARVELEICELEQDREGYKRLIDNAYKTASPDQQEELDNDYFERVEEIKTLMVNLKLALPPPPVPDSSNAAQIHATLSNGAASVVTQPQIVVQQSGPHPEDITQILSLIRPIESFANTVAANKPSPEFIRLRIKKLEDLEARFDKYVAQNASVEVEDEIREVFDSENNETALRINKIFELLCAGLHAESSRSLASVPFSSQIKLESLKVPQFNGDVKEWLTFRDKFKSLIHDNTSLTGVTKFTYLKQAIIDKNSPIAGEHEQEDAYEDAYEDAWKRVQQFYGDDRILISSHFNAIQSIKKINNETADELKRVLNEAKMNVQAVKRIQTDCDLFEALIAHIVINQLDSHTRDLFETENKSKIPIWSTLQTFLNIAARC
jgi:Protein of unknown function (DUF1759)